MNWDSLVFGIFLGLAAWQDMKTKSISVWLYPVFGCLGMGMKVFEGSLGYRDFGGALIGVALLLLGRMTKDAIGSGDGWFFVVSGIFLGFWRNLEFLLYGLLLCGLVGGSCLVLGKAAGKNVRKQTVAFIPFLVPVWIWMVFL